MNDSGHDKSSTTSNSSSSEESRTSDDRDENSLESQEESSTSYCSSSSSVKKTEQQEDNYHQDDYCTQVQSWTNAIPIGLGLCPWALKSRYQGRLQYITCHGNTPTDVQEMVEEHCQILCQAPLWSTCLLICPFVTKWQDDFASFDAFVRQLTTRPENSSCDNNEECRSQITFVAFHPQFLRWRGLASHLTVGSLVHSHRSVGLQKSHERYPARILETSNRMFGKRKIKVQFLSNDLPQSTEILDSPTTTLSDVPTHVQQQQTRKDQQYVSIDWLEDPDMLGPALLDNEMHQSPYPTIHLIRNADLGTLSVRSVSRVKRQNARRMMQWEGSSLAMAQEDSK